MNKLRYRGPVKVGTTVVQAGDGSGATGLYSWARGARRSTRATTIMVRITHVTICTITRMFVMIWGSILNVSRTSISLSYLALYITRR